MIVRSSDGVEIAVHDLGGTGSPLLISHATGFHGRCYEPVAHALADRCHSVAFDYRGHGDTDLPDGPIVWENYGEDALAIARWMVEQHGQPIDAFGHSMGGACLLMAAHRQPSLFRRLVLFEPIVFPPSGIRPPEQGGNDPEGNPMVIAARRRRATFPSFQAAIDNYASKPPLNEFTTEALRSYVLHGFTPDDDGVHLKCRPDTEAATFATGSGHDTWERLPTISTDTLVVAGRVEPMQPSTIAAGVAERLPNGRYLQLDVLDHFGPMVRPLLVADLTAQALSRT